MILLVKLLCANIQTDAPFENGIEKFSSEGWQKSDDYKYIVSTSERYYISTFKKKFKTLEVHL